MRVYHDLFRHMVSVENLFRAWDEFHKGKQSRKDVQEFEWNLEANIFALHRDLIADTYKHGPYHSFSICDPKQRNIHKATVRDRLLHHAVFAVLNPVFERTFYAHSYSCRKGKGTHRAMKTLHSWLRKVSQNNYQPCFVLQCDIRKFFDSLSHPVLLGIISRRVQDVDVVRLVNEIVGSYAVGCPIGNLTSQLFANIYLNELDQFIKHQLGITYYIRYSDDFAIVGTNYEDLEQMIQPIASFLHDRLFLLLHPRKVTIRKYRQGFDFLGYVLLPHHRVIRTKTKKRMFRKLGTLTESLQSSLGMLSHANAYRLSEELKNEHWFVVKMATDPLFLCTGKE